MDRHPYFTQIPQRSFDAIVREGWLSEILLALVVDPDASDEIADSMLRDWKTQNIRLDPNPGSEKPYAAPISAADFADLETWMVDKWRVTLAQWVMQFKEARGALQSLIRYDLRLGVWCACQVAREALPYLRKYEDRPLRAIEATESWVRGQATIAKVQNAAYSASYAAEAAADAAYHAANAAYSDAPASAAWHAANAEADAAAIGSSAQPSQWAQQRNYELARLRAVIAEACMTFPILVPR